MAEPATGLAETGQLGQTPLAELLVRLDVDKFSGTLELAVANRTHVVVLVSGRPVKAQLAVPVEPLGRILIERGLVEPVKLDALLASQPATGRQLGQLLLEHGLVDAATLNEALREQVRRRLLRLMLGGEGSYRLVPRKDLLEGRGGLDQPLDALALIPEGIRNSHSTEELETRMFNALAGRKATVARSDAFDRLGFSPQEQSACRYLAKGTWDATVFNAVPSEHKHTLLVAAYCLLLARQIAFVSPSFAPAVAAGAGPVDEAMRREILELRKSLKQRNHFELLGVAEDVAEEALKTRYLELVKRFHPDRAARHGLTGHKLELEEILLHIREAYDTLLDPQARQQYLTKLKGGKDAEAEVQDVVERALAAERSYQMAVMLERQHRLDEAQEAADEALRNAPDQGEFVCMSLYLQALRRPVRASVDDLVPKMLEAAGTVPKHERAQMQTGRLLQRAGRSGEAVTYFRRVVQVNPQNVDAAREVRLGEMRTSREGPAPAGGSLLDKLFRRKDRPR